MSRPRFLADNDLRDQIVAGLLRRCPGCIVRARSLGLADRPDAELLEYGATKGFVIVSHDVNTMPAAAYARMLEGKPMAGLLMSKQTAPVALVIDSLVLLHESSESEEWLGVVAFLPL